MNRPRSELMASIVAACAKLLDAAKKSWASAAGRTRKYRPEAYYMRGPGPKWRAKNAHISAQR